MHLRAVERGEGGECVVDVAGRSVSPPPSSRRMRRYRERGIGELLLTSDFRSTPRLNKEHVASIRHIAASVGPRSGPFGR